MSDQNPQDSSSLPDALVKANEARIEQSEEEMSLARSLEDEVLHESIEIVRGMNAFAYLDGAEDETVPQHFIDECGGDVERAKRMARVARASWMAAKEAPVALLNASKVAMAIIRAKSMENSVPSTLNATVVYINQPVMKGDDKTEYPVIDVEPE